MKTYRIKYGAYLVAVFTLLVANCSKDKDSEEADLIKFSVTPKSTTPKEVSIPKSDTPSELILHDLFNNTRTQGSALTFSLGSTPTGVQISKDTILTITKDAKAGKVTVQVTQKKTSTHQAGEAKADVLLVAATSTQLQSSPVSFKNTKEDAYYLVPGDASQGKRTLSEYIENATSIDMEYSLEKVNPPSNEVKLEKGVLSITDKVSTTTKIEVRFSHAATAKYKAFSEVKTFSVKASTAAATAKYKISFFGHWTEKRHHSGTGVAFPSGAHFTTMVGVHHAAGTSLFNSGEKATPGLESVAEDGVTATLLSEIKTKFEDQKKGQAILFFLSSGGEGTGSTEITVSKETPLLSLVSMIAPTADWFISFKGSFLNDDGTWKDDFTIDAIAYDAGTEEGEKLTRSNPDTNPQENISRLNIKTPFNITDGKVTPPLATLTLEKL